MFLGSFIKITNIDAINIAIDVVIKTKPKLFVYSKIPLETKILPTGKAINIPTVQKPSNLLAIAEISCGVLF